MHARPAAIEDVSARWVVPHIYPTRAAIRALRRPRLVWFADLLGMACEGLTRHLETTLGFT